MPIHETDLGRNRHLLNSLNHAIDLGLTDALLAPLTTEATLKAAVLALVVHETYSNLQRQINKNIDVGVAAGILTTTNITAGDTAALLEGIMVALDTPNLVAGERRTFAFQG